MIRAASFLKTGIIENRGECKKMSRILTKLTPQTSHLEWLGYRQKGIGGSDAAAILGMNRWKSPIDIWLSKTQEIDEANEDNKQSEYAYWGNVLEEIVAAEFCKRTGLAVRRRNAILMHDKYDYIIANIDREVVGQKVGLECKTASAYKKEEWTEEEIPAEYIIQCQHYMAVTGYEAWWIACLIGGNQFIYKKIERDEEFIEILLKAECEFWNSHVITNVMPPVDGSEASMDALEKMYPEADSELSVVLDADDEKLLKERQSLNELSKQTKSRIDEIENQIKQKMGNAECAKGQNYDIKWGNTSRTTVDGKKLKVECPDIYEKYKNVSTSRRFTVKEIV